MQFQCNIAQARKKITVCLVAKQWNMGKYIMKHIGLLYIIQLLHGAQPAGSRKSFFREEFKKFFLWANIWHNYYSPACFIIQNIIYFPEIRDFICTEINYIQG